VSGLYGVPFVEVAPHGQRYGWFLAEGTGQQRDDSAVGGELHHRLPIADTFRDWGEIFIAAHLAASGP